MRTPPTLCIAMVAGASLVAASPTLASSGTPPPDDGVELIDDAGVIRVDVPVSWTDITTASVVLGDGLLHPVIAASGDLDGFFHNWASGVLVYTTSPVADPRTMIDKFGIDDRCASVDVAPYDDGEFVGVIQTGIDCNDAGTTWQMVVAEPADHSYTAVIQTFSATPDDEPAVTTVLDSFGGTGFGSPTPIPSPLYITPVAPGDPTVLDCGATSIPGRTARAHEDARLVIDDVAVGGTSGLTFSTNSPVPTGSARTLEIVGDPSSERAANVVITGPSGDTVATVVGVTPGASCSVVVELPTGTSVITTSLTVDSDVDWAMPPKDVPATADWVDCSVQSQPATDAANATDAVHIEIAEGEGSGGGGLVGSLPELEDGFNDLTFSAAADNTEPATVTVSRDGDTVAVFSDIAPGSMCTETQYLGAGTYRITSDVTGELDATFEVVG